MCCGLGNRRTQSRASTEKNIFPGMAGCREKNSDQARLVAWFFIEKIESARHRRSKKLKMPDTPPME